jgi:hypothetical protein
MIQNLIDDGKTTFVDHGCIGLLIGSCEFNNFFVSKFNSSSQVHQNSSNYEMIMDRVETAFGDDDKVLKFETLRVT